MGTRIMALAIVCATAGIVHADTAKAKAANKKGYALHKKKKYKAAAVEYRKAIAEDPNYLLAHYNLACAASLLHDGPTAIAELAWVFDRANWDPAAKAAILKSRKDTDLKWVLDDEETMDQAGTFTNPTNIEDISVLTPTCCFARSKAAEAAAAKTLASAPGAHDEKCSAAVIASDLDSWLAGKGTVVGSMRDGIAVLDTAGKLVARSEPVGCSAANDKLIALNNGGAVPSPMDWYEAPVSKLYDYVAVHGSGTTEAVAIFIRKDTKLVRVFDAVTKNDKGSGSVTLTTLGNLVYTPPGEKKKHVFGWDDKAFKYVQTEEK